MNDNARKIFDILGVEPNEKFKVRISDVNADYEPNNYVPLNGVYYIDENLFVYIDGSCKTVPRVLRPLLNGTYKIIKLPKEPNKKKLRDLTPEEWNKWRSSCTTCYTCIFKNVICDKTWNDSSWINNKDTYSEKFLDQEIEVEE